MNKTEYLPIVTLAQAVAYDPEKPETVTPSRIVNLLVETLPHVHGANAKSLSEYLGMSAKAIAGAVEFDTGMTFETFLENWRVGVIHRMKIEDPKERGDALAHRLGFSNRTALWLFMKRKKLMPKRLSRAEADAEFRARWARMKMNLAAEIATIRAGNKAD